MEIITTKSILALLAGLFLIANQAGAQSGNGGLALSLKLSSPGQSSAATLTTADLSVQNIESALSQGLISIEAPAVTDVTVIESTTTLKAERQRRHIQLSPDQIVVILSDQNGEQVYKAVQIDPRLLRAEVPGDDGNRVQREFYFTNAVLDIVIPQVEGALQLELLKPIWDGSEFTLQRLSLIDISAL